MPTSSPSAITKVISALQELKPKSILEIGPGFGKYGFLAREFLELWGNQRYGREDWIIRMDCIEAFPEYITPCHNYLYNNIYIGDATSELPKCQDYEVIMLFDVIEHFTPEAGLKLIELMKQKAKGILLTTPVQWLPQKDSYNNKFETHQSHWKEETLKELGFECILCSGESDSKEPPIWFAIWHQDEESQK